MSFAAIISSIYNIDEPSSYNQTASELRKAREAIWKGMSSLEKLEKELETKAADFSEVKKRLDALEQAEKLSKEELKSTLDAINYTQSWFDWRNVSLGFILGIISSLIATWLMNIDLFGRFKKIEKEASTITKENS